MTTTQVWDGSNLVMELTGDTVTGTYLRGVGLIAADLGGTRSYYLYNAHGDVTGLTNTAGTLTQSYDYDAFGNEKTASNESDTNPFRYCGEYLDAETGSYYLRARYYEPGLGRFLSEDPAQSGLNWYTYCGNNPVMFVDPSGMFAEGETLSYGKGNKTDIEMLQQRLYELGYYKGEIDGSFGPMTRTAVNAYKDAYLPGGNTGSYSGVVGATTWNSLGLELEIKTYSSSYIFPVDNPRVSCPYADTKYHAFHQGVDFRGKEGDNIYSIANGTVIGVSKNSERGLYIYIQNDDGSRAVYQHNSENLVKVGDTVKQGQVIGKIGYSGHVIPKGSRGSHLHFELIFNFTGSGIPYAKHQDAYHVDPMDYLGK